MSTVKIISNFSQIVNCFHIDEHVKRTHMMSNTYKIGLYVINKSRATQKIQNPSRTNSRFFFIFLLKYVKLVQQIEIFSLYSQPIIKESQLHRNDYVWSKIIFKFVIQFFFQYFVHLFFAFYFKLYIYLTNYRKTLNRHREEKRNWNDGVSIEKNKILSRRRRTTKSWNALKSKIVTMINKLDL